MKKYFILFFLILTSLFNNKVGECALYEFDFKGYITGISTYPTYPIPAIEDLMGVSIGSKMTSSSIYDTDPYLSYSNEFVDVYRMPSALVLNFQPFTVSTGSEFVIYKDAPDYWDIIYGSPASGRLYHEDGWSSKILGGSVVWFENKTGISYTLESFPTLLDNDNFDIGFSFGSFVPCYRSFVGGPDPLCPSDLPPIQVSISGVIDKVKTHPVEVPEPSTLLLLGIGLMGLAGYGRRRFKINNANR